MKCWNKDCANVLHASAVVCPVCGRERPKKVEGEKSYDPLRYLCSDVDHRGNKCGKTATLSSNTYGEGPWFCLQHFPAMRGIFSAPTAPSKPENPTSQDLSDQQWYNVCKHYPNVARRTARPLVQVGPDQPLDKTSSAGPLIARHWGPLPEREPGQDG